MNRFIRSLICILLIFALSLNLFACGRIVETSEDDEMEEEETRSKENNTRKDDVNIINGDDDPVVVPDPAEDGQEAIFLQPYARVEDGPIVYGYADPSGNIVIEPVFLDAQPFFKCGLAIVTDVNGKMGLIDKTGKYVVDPEWNDVSYSDGVFICYTYDGRYSNVYDEKGTFLFMFNGYASKMTEGYVQCYDRDNRGYIDMNGNLAIRRDGDGAMGDFVDGIAAVADKYLGPAYFIDKNGNDLTNSVSSGLRMYKDEESGLFGYKNEKGEIVIPAAFSDATPFLNGYAIVNVSEDYYYMKYGVIDTSGKFLLEPEHCGYTRLSNGLVALGEKVSADVFLPYDYYSFSRKALFTSDFSKSTDWIYYDVTDFDSENACVYDGENTYFLDRNLYSTGDLPILRGKGSFYPDNDLLRGEYNGKLTVLDRKGAVISQASGNVDLGGGIVAGKQVKILTPAAKIAYPALTGMKDKSLQDRINSLIVDEMLKPYEQLATFYGPEDTTYVDSDYSLSRKKDLLMIDQSLYSYYLGAAHGNGFRNTVYIDIATGVQYGIKDLFREDDREIWNLLSARVTADLRANEEIGYFVDSLEITPDSFVALYEDSIGFYYGQDEIAGYAAGIVEFKVPFSEIYDHIDTEGAFWKSFN